MLFGDNICFRDTDFLCFYSCRLAFHQRFTQCLTLKFKMAHNCSSLQTQFGQMDDLNFLRSNFVASLANEKRK